MNDLLLQYLPIIIFFGIATIIGSGFLVAAFLMAPKAPDSEKLSAYECGFNAFDSARQKFDIRFYLVSILFIVFDIEVAFLFPWAVTLFEADFSSKMIAAFWTMMIFIFELAIGYVYVWKKGALEWE